MRHCFLVIVLGACAQTTNAITLDVLLQDTVKNNPAIQSAKSNLEEAAGRRLVIHSALLPKARIGSVIGVQGGHRAGEKPIQPFGAGYGNLSQPLFNVAGPAVWRRGNIEVLLAEQQLNVAVVEQLHAARIAFYTALYNRDLATLRREQRQQLQENAATQEARYQAGQADRSAFVGADVQTRALDPDIANAERAYQAALLQLSEAVGRDLQKTVEPEGALSSADINVTPETATTMALQRPDLQLARLFVRAAGEDQRIIAACYYPAIRATVSGEYIPVSGVRREGGSTGSPHRSDDVISSELREGAAYTWRVIDNGRISGVVERKRAAREINEALVQQMEQQIPRDLSRIQNDLRAIAEKEKDLKNASTGAEENAKALRKNLEQGISSQLEYRLAQNDLLKIHAGLLTLAYQRSLALAEWDRVTGRYLHFSDEAK